MLYFELQKSASRGTVPGKCAQCKAVVHEHLWRLDDCYNVYAGKCPHCAAINLLGLNSLRGYSSTGMTLVLPTDEEKAANDMPADCPTRGSHGPATAHGSVSGEIAYQLSQGGA